MIREQGFGINWEAILYWSMFIAVLVGLMAMILTAGCITAGKNIYREATATPIPTTTPPTPRPTPIPTTPTPIPTPKSLPTLAPHYVDPLLHGERWEGQWFKWVRMDVQGLKDLDMGIVVYRHAFLDSYTWWNGALGNYQVEKPREGYRYFAVWVHEEMFGNSSTNDPRIWAFDETSFRLQIKDTVIESDPNLHNLVNRIKEFDYQYDYYNTITAPPFGYYILYTGTSPETAGMVAMKTGWLRMGKGNAIDGYVLFEVPEKTMESDLLFLGNFARFGNAYWRFTR